MKTTFQKAKPKLIYYRDYSMFSNNESRKDLFPKLSKEIISNTSYGLEIFLQICARVLDKLPPQNKKYNRGNSMSIMNKPLARALLKRSRLGNLFLKTGSSQQAPQ